MRTKKVQDKNIQHLFSWLVFLIDFLLS